MVLARLCKLQRALAVELTVEEFASVDGTRREAVGAVPLHAPILALASVHGLLRHRHEVMQQKRSGQRSRRKVGGTNPKGQTNPKCLNARLTETCAETCFVPH